MSAGSVTAPALAITFVPVTSSARLPPDWIATPAVATALHTDAAVATIVFACAWLTCVLSAPRPEST